jgi:serine/threonine protein kinase/WD40 repeat protein
MPTDQVDALLQTLLESDLLTPAQVEECRAVPSGFADAKALARHLLQRDYLTAYQVNHILQGKVNELFLDNYILLERVGQGGMGQVFRARHRVMNRVVALKFIRQERLTNSEQVKRFHREIRMAAQLKHPNIVMSYDADQAGDTTFLVMEFVEGTDLARFVEKNGRRPVAQACDWIRQAALGLQHAHERGMIHRDIKPANLLLSVKENVVKVLDLGLARVSQSADAELTALGLTLEGTVMGTPDYMAPEQAEESTTVDIRADIYSLGGTLYYLLAGHVPFPGGTLAQKLRKHAQAQPEPLTAQRDDIPPGLSAVLAKMMAKQPEDRYQTPSDVAAALAPFCCPGSITAVPEVADSRPVAVPLLDDTLTFEPQPVAVPIAASAVPPQASETVPLSALDSVPSVTLRKASGPLGRVQEVWRRAGPRGQVATVVGAVVLVMLVGIVLCWPKTPQKKPEPEPDTRTVLERLDAEQIPKEDRPDWQSRELRDVLVAVLGEHRVRLSSFLTLAVRPDRAKVAVSDDGVIRLVDTRTLRQEREFNRDGRSAHALAFSADGKRLAAGYSDAAVRLWDVQSGNLLREFPGAHDGVVRAVAFTHDGKRLLSAGDDARVHVWDVAVDRKPLQTFTGHKSPLRALAVSRDDKLAYSAAAGTGVGMEADNDVLVWEINTAKPQRVADQPRILTGHSGSITRLEMSSDGTHLLAGTTASHAYLWDLGGHPDKPQALTAIENNSTFTTDATFVAEDRIATCASTYLKLWFRTERGTWQAFDPIPLTPTTPAVAGLTAVPNDNNPEAADRGVLLVADNTLRVWNFTKKKEWRPPLGHTQPVRQVAFTEDGRGLISADDATVRSWDFAELYDPTSHWPREARAALVVPTTSANPFAAAAFSEDGRRVLTFNTGETAAAVWVWENETWIRLRKLGPEGAQPTDTLTAVALSPDGTRALTADVNKTLRIWDVSQREEKRKLEGLPERSRQVGFLADGWGYSWDGNELRLWEGLRDGDNPQKVVVPGVGGTALVVSPERDVAIAGSGSGQLYRWTDLAGGKPVRSVPDHWQQAPITALALSPDRKRLLAGSSDERLALWDVAPDTIPQPQFLHLRGAPSALAFAPDGRHVAVGNPNGTIYILRLPANK